MRDFEYGDAPVPVRADLRAAHRRAWERLARPGTWWTGPERLAIAAEVRQAAHCALCRERSKALSPLHVAGKHEHLGALSEAAVEVIHQVTRDPARLSKTWFEKTLAGGLSDAQYVEIVGVVVTVVSIDSFCRGIGVPLRPLPEPQPGDPSRYRPPGALPEGAWVPMIRERRARGAEADLYSTFRTGNVIRALSLVPDEVRGLQDLSAAHYLSPEQVIDLRARRALDRAQIELVAGRVSALNECFY
jgi:alkylhydroperoxidase family enzyme